MIGCETCPTGFVPNAEQSNCVEALPQQAKQTASDGSLGPCTLMGAAGALDSETFSTLERSSIRDYVRRYARG